MAGSRFGIKATLLAGLTCQLVALAMLAGWRAGWPTAGAVAYITVAQVLNGVAKVREGERERGGAFALLTTILFQPSPPPPLFS